VHRDQDRIIDETNRHVLACLRGGQAEQHDCQQLNYRFDFFLSAHLNHNPDV